VQILEDHDQRLVQTLAQKQPLQGIESPLTADLCIHLLQHAILIVDAEQREQVRQRVLEAAVERQHLAGYLLSSFTLVVIECDVEIIP